MLGDILRLVLDTMRWCGIPLKRRRIVYVPGQRDVVREIVARRGDLEFLRDELDGEFGNADGRRVQPHGFVPPTIEDLGAAPVVWNTVRRRWEPWWLA
jgi:hypothetical protein